MSGENIKSADQVAMECYEYIVDHAESGDFDILSSIEKLKENDMSGQFLCSTARYLYAINDAKYHQWIAPLVEGAIDKDRDRKYIGSLLQALWGEDYEERVNELCASDNNFRRIYKRIFPIGAL